MKNTHHQCVANGQRWPTRAVARSILAIEMQSYANLDRKHFEQQTHNNARSTYIPKMRLRPVPLFRFRAPQRHRIDGNYLPRACHEWTMAWYVLRNLYPDRRPSNSIIVTLRRGLHCLEILSVPNGSSSLNVLEISRREDVSCVENCTLLDVRPHHVRGLRRVKEQHVGLNAPCRSPCYS